MHYSAEVMLQQDTSIMGLKLPLPGLQLPLIFQLHRLRDLCPKLPINLEQSPTKQAHQQGYQTPLT